MNVDWTPLRGSTADDAATFFMEMLWVNLCTFIPYEVVDVKKKSHPWLTTKCEDAIRNKNAAEHTSTFDETRTKCAAVLSE